MTLTQQPHLRSTSEQERPALRSWSPSRSAERLRVWLGTTDARRRLTWISALLVSVLVLTALPLLRTPTYYFWNDTSAGALGQWYYLGERLLSGRWPILDPSLWRGGNLMAEGQMGLYSPLSIGIGITLWWWAQLGGNLVVYVTLLKAAMLCCAALGTYLLTRSYAAPRWAGFVAGVSVTAGGFTRYLDAPSWVTGLEIWALLPLFWWALRRCLRQGANPLPALVLGYLMVTTGYVYGCLYVGLVVLACVADAWLTGRRRRPWAVLGVGVCCAVLAITVYLPGVLTASVTVRSGTEVVSDGRMAGDLFGMLGAVLPVPEPVSYVCWFVPLLVLVDGRRAAGLLKPLAGLLIFGVLTALWILGPQQMGPLRYPSRLMPAYVLVVVILVCVLLAQARVRRPTRTRLVLAVAWTLAVLWVAASRAWASGGLAVIAAAAVLVGLGVAWRLWRREVWRFPTAGLRDIELPADGVVAVWLVVWTTVVLSIHYAAFPVPPQLNRLLPQTLSGFQQQASAARGDTMFIGNADAAMASDPQLSSEFLLANTWMLNPTAVQNTYSLAGFERFSVRYCYIYNGMTCSRALRTLFTEEPTTGRLRVDLLSISSLIIYRPDVPDLDTRPVPAGWRVAQQGRTTTTWVREAPLPGAGGVVWASPGTAVTTSHVSDTSVGFRVQRVGSRGGTVALSRLAFPGYRVEGAEVVGPTDGYLLTVWVPADSEGRTVRVVFRPPGWTLELIALALAAVALVGWPLAAAYGRRRPREMSGSRRRAE